MNSSAFKVAFGNRKTAHKYGMEAPETEDLKSHLQELIEIGDDVDFVAFLRRLTYPKVGEAVKLCIEIFKTVPNANCASCLVVYPFKSFTQKHGYKPFEIEDRALERDKVTEAGFPLSFHVWWNKLTGAPIASSLVSAIVKRGCHEAAIHMCDSLSSIEKAAEFHDAITTLRGAEDQTLEDLRCTSRMLYALERAIKRLIAHTDIVAGNMLLRDVMSDLDNVTDTISDIIDEIEEEEEEENDETDGEINSTDVTEDSEDEATGKRSASEDEEDESELPNKKARVVVEID